MHLHPEPSNKEAILRIPLDDPLLDLLKLFHLHDHVLARILGEVERLRHARDVNKIAACCEIVDDRGLRRVLHVKCVDPFLVLVGRLCNGD